MASKEFEELSIPEWKINSGDATGKVYRVFSNAHDFQTIEAENASEAISKCGTQQIYMIKFGNMDNHGIIGMEMLTKMQNAELEAAANPA